MYEVIDFYKWKETSEKTVYRFPAEGSEWILIKVKSGSTVGEHYHKGTAKTKNPEVLCILEGKIEVYLKDLKSGKEVTITIESPKIIEIKPFVYHEMKALTPAIMLEPYSEEGMKDKYLLENKS